MQPYLINWFLSLFTAPTISAGSGSNVGFQCDSDYSCSLTKFDNKEDSYSLCSYTGEILVKIFFDMPIIKAVIHLIILDGLCQCTSMRGKLMIFESCCRRDTPQWVSQRDKAEFDDHGSRFKFSKHRDGSFRIAPAHENSSPEALSVPSHVS